MGNPTRFNGDNELSDCTLNKTTILHLNDATEQFKNPLSSKTFCCCSWCYF